MKYTKSSITDIGKESDLHPIKKALASVLGSGFFTGYLPFAQGTAGSALFVVLWWFFVPSIMNVEIAILTTLFVLSIPVSKWGEELWGEDPGRITIDEFVGQGVALLFLPKSIIWYFAAFILFRIFDTFKFSFIKKYIEPIPKGWGVVLDDIVAGLIARMILLLIMNVL